MTQRVFLFPGQGSQALGMGHDFYNNFQEARHVFDEVDETLAPFYGQKLSTVIFEGPSETLTQTLYTQAALMTTSIAMFRTLEKEYGKPLAPEASFMIGHSLGEYSALCAGGVVSLKDTATLLYYRGKAMTESAPADGGAMAAIIGLEIEDVDAITQAAGCFVANDNGGGQVVISGTKESVTKAMALATEKGAKRALPLNVSAPFHCPLIKKAADIMADKIAPISFANTPVPVITNTDAVPTTEGTAFKAKLVDQICGRVRFRESVALAFDKGATQFIEIGSGKVLTGLVKRIAPDATTLNMTTTADIETFLDSLSTKVAA